MRMKKLSALGAVLITTGFCLGVPLCNAQQTDRLPTSQLDKLAIQESIAGYLIAINDRDANVAASYWSDTGEWIAEDGTRVRGTDNIATALADSFDNDPTGMSISLRNLTIRLVSPTVAIEDGLAVISIPGEAETEATYSVVHVKTNGG